MNKTPATDEFEPTEAADAAFPLGPPTDLYELTAADQQKNILIAVGVLALSLLAFWFGFSSSSSQTKLFSISAGIGLLIGAVYLFYRWYLQRDLHVLLSAEGLTVVRNDTMVAYHWGEIESVFQNLKVASVSGIRGRTSKTYTVVPKKGDVIELTEILPNVEQLVGKIQGQITNRRLPEDLQLLADGKSLRFGPISISRNEITTRQKTLPWDQVGSVQIIEGTLIIRDKSKRIWNQSLVSEIPNLSLLLSHFKAKQVDI